MTRAPIDEGAARRVRDVAGLLKEKEYSAALEAAEQATQQYPECADLWVNRGIALRKLGRLDDAFAAYDRAIEIDPNDPDCWLNRGICVRAMNRPEMHEKAVASYTRAVELDPDCADALQNLGNVSNRLAYFFVSEAEAKKEYFRKSEEAYQRALRMKPDNWELYGNMAVVLIKQGRFREAIEQADRSIELKPDYADAWYLRGYALTELGRLEEALEAYHQAASVMPPGDDFGLRVWINAGNVLFQMGRADDALGAYDRAASIDPKNRMYYRGCKANAWYNKAVAYKRLGKDEEAWDAYRESARLRSEEETFMEPVKEFVGPAACDTEHIKEGA
ncbi:MAG: tetratricopeptide repeat protein [Armatimonadetes bacterium]|nr:tetratricopeptide repeat protein [Armatimonadota bacterium]